MASGEAGAGDCMRALRGEMRWTIDFYWLCCAIEEWALCGVRELGCVAPTFTKAPRRLSKHRDRET